MDSLSTQLPHCSSATAKPQWMALGPYGGGIEEDCNITGDPTTIAATATSNGQHIIVSLRREPYLAMSRICLCFLPGRADSQSAYSTVIAAHAGSVLVRIASNEGYRKPCACDYFVYSNMGAADPTRPPSLFLLPVYTPPPPKPWWGLDRSATGLLCHGQAEFVVAELKIVESKDDAAAAIPTAFELHLYRHGEWCVKQPRIIGDCHGKDDEDLQHVRPWEPVAVVPLGDGRLCWVDRCQYRGVIFSDVLQESPELRYVPYPADAVSYRWTCFLCTNAHGELKLVSLSPGRCSHCGCSEHVTAVNTWALKTDDMAWVLETETMADSTDELWALETRVGVGYARGHLVYPVARMNADSHRVVPDESSAPSHQLKRFSTLQERGISQCGSKQKGHQAQCVSRSIGTEGQKEQVQENSKFSSMHI